MTQQSSIHAGTIRFRAKNQLRAEAELNREPKLIDALGGDGLKIVSFPANPRIIGRDCPVEVCYGVTGAKRSPSGRRSGPSGRP